MRTQHFNIFNTGTESFFTPGTQLASIARVKPDVPAVIYVSPENKESVMTWRELHELSNRIAWYLLDQGIGPGKSVLAALPNIPTHFALAFGIWKTGACYVPVSNRAPQRNLMEICSCVSPALVITNRKKPDGYPGLSTAELKTLCAGCPADLPPDVLAIPNLANCSGGTTGKTKVIEQDMPAGESDEGLRTWFAVSGMRFEMRQLLAGPLFHGAPHSAAFNGLYCGNTIVMPAKLDAETIVQLIKKYRIEYVQMVPTLMQRISRMPGFRKEDLASLEVLCHTGGVCSQDLKREWLQIIPPERLYPRVLPTLESIAACEAANIPHRNIIAMQGPFSFALNQAMMEQFHIRWLVTKDGGAAGGFDEKAAAASAAGAQLVVIRRPPEQGETASEVLKRCKEMIR